MTPELVWLLRILVFVGGIGRDVDEIERRRRQDDQRFGAPLGNVSADRDPVESIDAGYGVIEGGAELVPPTRTRWRARAPIRRRRKASRPEQTKSTRWASPAALRRPDYVGVAPLGLLIRKSEDRRNRHRSRLPSKNRSPLKGSTARPAGARQVRGDGPDRPLRSPGSICDDVAAWSNCRRSSRACVQAAILAEHRPAERLADIRQLVRVGYGPASQPEPYRSPSGKVGRVGPTRRW